MKNSQCENRMKEGNTWAAGEFIPVFVGALGPENRDLVYSWGCFKKIYVHYD